MTPDILMTPDTANKIKVTLQLQKIDKTKTGAKR